MSYEIRPYRDGDEHAILATYNLVFAEGKESYEPRTVDDWAWTYRENPAGLRVWLGMDGERVAAHYAALPYRVRIDGHEAVFGQLIDSMVHPDDRRGLKREGLFASVARGLIDATTGPERDYVLFGWPVPAAWRMSKTFLGSQLVRRQNLLSGEPAPGSPELPAGVELLERFDESVDALYERCAPAWGASVVRDRAWLAWRFERHPFHRYRLLGARAGDGSLAGYAVLRFSDWPVPGCGIVADWMVPPDAPEVAELLHAATMAEARRHGAARVLAVFPEWDRWFDWFQGLGWRVSPSAYPFAAIPRHPRYDRYWLRDHWWTTFAEMDLA